MKITKTRKTEIYLITLYQTSLQCGDNMKKRKAEEVLEIMISQLLRYLEELCECKNETGQQFKYGERTAYKESSEKKKTAVFSRRSQARKPPFFFGL